MAAARAARRQSALPSKTQANCIRSPGAASADARAPTCARRPSGSVRSQRSPDPSHTRAAAVPPAWSTPAAPGRPPRSSTRVDRAGADAAAQAAARLQRAAVTRRANAPRSSANVVLRAPTDLPPRPRYTQRYTCGRRDRCPKQSRRAPDRRDPAVRSVWEPRVHACMATCRLACRRARALPSRAPGSIGRSRPMRA